MFFIGLSGFLAASLACGLAPSPWFLLGARLAQGIFASLVFPQVLALTHVNFPEHERPKALAYFGLAVALASIAGQILGGLLIHLDLLGWGWRWLFLINLPIGAVALTIAARTLHETRSENPPTLDMSGVVIVSLGLALLLVPLVEGHEQGWPPWAIAMLVASVPVLWLFARHERSASSRGRDPLVDPKLFELKTFRRGLAMITSYFIGGGSMFLILSIYEQQGLGKDAMAAALTFGGFAVALLVSSITASRLVSLHRTKFLYGGFAFLCAGVATIVVGLAVTATGDARLAITIGLASYGFGQGCVSPVMYSTALTGVPIRSAGAASGVLATFQQIASAMGVALIGLVFSTVLHGASGGLAHAHAAACALTVNLASMMLASFLALRLPHPTTAGAPVVEA